MTQNACCVWDFTLRKGELLPFDLTPWLKTIAKQYCYQEERGEGGYEHYQGRVSLKMKTRMPETRWGIHWSVTSSANRDNMFYVMKEESRVAGPWTDKDEEIYIPRQIREIEKLYPWQERVIELSRKWDTRHIDVLWCETGNKGKSVLKGWMRVHKLGTPLPFCNDFKDIMRMVMDMPTDTCYIIDMPRAVNKDRLFQLYAGIESIKDGYAYDDRYAFKDKYFDCPNVWVFTNTCPDVELLSRDRWRIWGIDDEMRLFRR